MKFFLLIFFLLQHALLLHAQNANLKWARQMGGSSNADYGNAITTDAAGNVYTTGIFNGTADFDPGTGTYNLTCSSNYFEMFICKLDAAGNFVWAKKIGGTNSWSAAYGSAIALDATGNIYTSGTFFGTIDFDPGAAIFDLSSYNVNPNSNRPTCFVSKLDAAGNFVWAKQMGGNCDATGSSIAVDAVGDVYTAGIIDGAGDFDPGPGTVILTGWQMFVTKLNASGNLIWAKATQDAGAVVDRVSMSLDAAGNIYCTGAFTSGGNLDCDPGLGVFYLKTMVPTYDIFILKWNTDGNFVWAKQMVTTVVGGTGAYGSTGLSVAIDGAGNVYTTGEFRGTVDFDPGAGIYSFTSAGHLYEPGNADMFISKLNAAGNFVWAKKLDTVLCGTIVGSSGSAIAVDALGDVFTTGGFVGLLDFDPGAGSYNLNTSGNGDMFMYKLNTDGSFIWAKQLAAANNISSSYGSAIALDAAGNIYTTGGFKGTVDIDPATATSNLITTGDYDILVHKMSKCISGTAVTLTIADCKDYTLNGHTYIATGTYTQVISNAVGCDSVITLNLTINRERADIYVSACANYTWRCHTYTTCNSTTTQCVTYTSSGVYTDTVHTANACDSIIILHLTIGNKVFTNITKTICSGQFYGGHNTSGTFIDTFISSAGCDSVRTLQLTVLPRSFSTIDKTICNGQTYNGHNSSGTYNDTFIAANGCDSIQTLQLTVLPKLTATINTTICEGQTYEGHSISGTYITRLTSANGCDSTITLQLAVMPKPKPNLGADTALCKDDVIQLYPGSFATCSWQDGSIQEKFIVKQPGVYAVVVTNNCGSASDEIIIQPGICDVYFPLAFTPDNDGRNELFKMLGMLNLKDYHLTVYNRYGQLVFETTNQAQGWNGKYKDQLQATGTYVWHCNFKMAGAIKFIKGTVILLK